MKKLLLFSILLLSMASFAFADGTYSNGTYGNFSYGISPASSSSFSDSFNTTAGTPLIINATQPQGNSTPNVTLELVTNASVSGAVTIVKYDSKPETVGTSTFSALNKYIDVVVDDSIKSQLNYSIIRMYYSDSDVASAGLDESSLRLSKWNGSEWIRYDTPNGGADTTNNFVWANTTAFSTWGVFGSTPTQPSSPAPSGGGGGGGCTASYMVKSPSIVEAEAVATAKISVTISNTGTCAGSAAVSATVPSGWSSTSATTKILGSNNPSETVSITVTIPNNAKTETITFNADISGRRYTSKTTVSIAEPEPESSLPLAESQQINATQNVTMIENATENITGEKAEVQSEQPVSAITGLAVFTTSNPSATAGAVVAVIIILILLFRWLLKRRHKRRKPKPLKSAGKIKGKPVQ